jgi:hypothetical protein
MKCAFNLKRHLHKVSFYEGAQELMRTDRKMDDCQKAFRDQGLGANEAWQKCQDLFDNKGQNGSHLE